MTAESALLVLFKAVLKANASEVSSIWEMIVPYELAVPLRGDKAVTSVDSIHEQKLLALPFCTLNGDNVAPLPKGLVSRGAWQGLLRVQVLPWPTPGLQATSPFSFQRAALRRTQDF